MKKAVVVKLIACKTYIKRLLSIQRKVNNQTTLCFKEEQEFFKMEYLKYVYEHFFCYEDSGCYKPLPKVVAFGNVLLDTTAQLADLKLLDEFNLTPDSRGELEVDIIAKLTDAACAGNDCPKNPGGSALNTCRILGQLGTVSLFFGAVGEDEAAAELKKHLDREAVVARLQHVSDVPTGQCIALVLNDKATLNANIGASAKFTVEYLKNEERDPFLRPIERKQIIYIEGFFVPHRQQVCEYIVNNYIRDRKRLALNLSGAYIVKQFSEDIIKLARSASFIFGNKSEFQALIDIMGFNSEEEMANELMQQGRIVKIIVITKGADGVTLITNYDDEFAKPGNLNFQNYNAQHIENVIDTTGAGDAFVAGFLHCWLRKRQLSECIRIAADLAGKVCTQIGCRLPKGVSLM